MKKDKAITIKLKDIPVIKKRLTTQLIIAIFGIIIFMMLNITSSFWLLTLFSTFFSLYYMYSLYKCSTRWRNLLECEQLLKNKIQETKNENINNR